ncbi:MAG: class I SAM-dependent methyltransferase, partial [Spirochaetota bacterium]
TNTTIGWLSKDSAYESYQNISNSPWQDWQNYASVLDIGCGEGHLFEYLYKYRAYTSKYIGIELLPLFYNNACELYANRENTEFICAEFLSHEFGTQKFDWVFSLGSLSVKQENQYEYDLASCQKMVSLAKYGVSVYLNDITNMRSGRQKELPHLAFHNVADFVGMLLDNFPLKEYEVVHFPDATSQKTIIHFTL